MTSDTDTSIVPAYNASDKQKGASKTSRIPIKMRGFFATEHFLVYWSWYHYLAAIGIAFAGVFLASYFPARRAAKLAPVDVLRGTGQ